MVAPALSADKFASVIIEGMPEIEPRLIRRFARLATKYANKASGNIQARANSIQGYVMRILTTAAGSLSILDPKFNACEVFYYGKCPRATSLSKQRARPEIKMTEFPF